MKYSYLGNLEFKIYEFFPKDNYRWNVPPTTQILSKGGAMEEKKKERHTYDYYLELAKKAVKKTDWDKAFKNKYFLFRHRKRHTTIFNYSF